MSFALHAGRAGLPLCRAVVFPVLAIMLLISTAWPAEEAPISAGLLKLQNGGVIPGEFRTTASIGLIRWQGSQFTQPFEFEENTLRSIQFPPDSTPPVQTGITFILANGDQLTGQVLDWTPMRIDLASEFGRIQLHTDSIRRFYRLDQNSQLIYPHLDGLENWSATKDAWQADGISLSTRIDKAALSRDLKIPARAIIEFELTWEKNADFILALGLRNPSKLDPKSTSWRIECWDNTLNLVAESPKVADVSPVAGVKLADRRVHLVAYLDQPAGALHLFHPDGTPAGQLQLPQQPAKARKNNESPSPGLRLVNRHGDIRLEQLRITQWNGELPISESLKHPRFELADGSSVTGPLTWTGSATGTTTGTVTIMNAGQPQSIPIKEMNTAQFNPAADIAQRSATMVLQSGTRISGILCGIKTDQLELVSPDIDDPLRIPYAQVVSLTFAGDAASPTLMSKEFRYRPPAGSVPPSQSSSRRAGQIVFRSGPAPIQPAPVAPPKVNRDEKAPVRGAVIRGNGFVMGVDQPNQEETPATVSPLDDPQAQKHPGKLVSGASQAQASCLVWQPDGSRTASPLKLGASGRIVYREPRPPTPEPKADPQRNQQGRGQGFTSLFLKKVDQPAARAPAGGQQSLHLLAGDVIPCTVLFVDEEGVTITSSVVDQQLIPHARIKAIEFISSARIPDLAAAKKDRLLTLPRLQKASPPTHLLCSRNGDFLRCRLLEIKDGRLKIELQLEELELPLDRIAQIIWLHPEQLLTRSLPAADQKPADETSAATTAIPPAAAPVSESEQASRVDYRNMVQVLRSDGKRATFLPQQVESDVVRGKSDVLGACRFQLSQVDQLIFGEEIMSDIAQLPYQQWCLHPAVEPLVAQDFGEGDPQDSPLVGQPAPEVDLELLSGGRFTLSKNKGQVILLDFWATWCGPCMQTIPLLHEMLTEFDPEHVQLISVNMEEPAQHVKSVLERHKFQLNVALDIDGVAAHRFQATAIPQLVLVNRAGTVTHVFVGGGPNMIQSLKTALNEVLQGQ